MPAPVKTSAQAVRADDVSGELASRLRLSINRLHRLLRQESLAGLSPRPRPWGP